MQILKEVIEDKDSFDFRGHSDGILLLLFIRVHCLEKWELNISVFCLSNFVSKNIFLIISLHCTKVKIKEKVTKGIVSNLYLQIKGIQADHAMDIILEPEST